MKKRIIIIVSGIALLALTAGGYGYWHGQRHQVDSASLYGGSSDYVNAADTVPQQSASSQNSQQSISATGTSQSGVTIPATSSTNQSTETSADNSAALAKLLDPTTFSQYDKYKTDTSAQYIDLQQGTGATFGNGQTAAVYYRGWLTNGTLFDQSQTGSNGKLQTFSFTQGQHQVISGWEEGLLGMKVGGVRLLIVPPAVGYGAAGQGQIPGNAVLVFQVQLVAVQ